MTNKIPVWISVLGSLLTLSGIAFSINLYFSPQTFFPEADFLAKDVKHFTDMWAMRQFAFSGLLVYGLIAQKGSTLKIGMWLLIAMNLLSIADAFLVLNYKVIIESIVYTVPAGIIIKVLNSRVAMKLPAIQNNN